ncbi:hypothetical protein [Acidisphaera sp. S103]|uniref:hypothetical protein n=1 Tax=Acidisphaera sp. S103 TaxID=1747223 RepID=UPI00131B3921|nr:hypothetical protein [Acidisphaera sp. S103]
MRLLLIIVAFLLCLPQLALTQTDKSSWIADSQTGCRVWNPHPQPNETVSWSGSCKGGTAEGPGVLRLFKDGKTAGFGEGEWRDGKREGRGVYTDQRGNRYDGEWHDDKENGSASSLIRTAAATKESGVMAK